MFYKRLCEEYDCPILPRFLSETIITAFKPSKVGIARQKSRNETDLLNLQSSPKSRRSPLALNGKSKNKNVSGVIQVNTSILSDKTV